MKICKKCKTEKDLSCFKMGRNICKDCNNTANRERYKTNPEKYRAKQKRVRDNWTEEQKRERYEGIKKRNDANPQRIKAYNKKYYEKHIDKIKEYVREYSKKNSAKIVERVKKWGEENKEKKTQHSRNFYKRHRDEILIKQKERLQTDLEYRAKHIESRKRTKAKHKEKIRTKNKEYNQRPEVKERQRLNQRKWREKNRFEVNRKRRERVAQNKEKYLDSTRYIKGFLIKQTNLKYADIPEELVDAYRLQMKLKREVRNVRTKSI